MVTTKTAARDIAIFGAGPAGLFAAEVIAGAGHRVTVFERMPSPARKFLMAGRGGLNLTHSEDLQKFLDRYGVTAAPALREAIEAFPPAALIGWANGLGCETFVGSSGRVFPKVMKTSPLLRAWLQRLAALGVTIATGHEWLGFAEGGAQRWRGPDGELKTISPAATLLALGGGSWARLGSNGQWTKSLDEAGVHISPLEASNCGVAVSWSPTLREKFAGTPLKRIALTCGNMRSRGECVITRDGLEGGAIYSLVPAIREALRIAGSTQILLDLRPDEDEALIARRLSRPRGGATLTNHLRKTLSLDPASAALLREGPLPQTPEGLARLIKAVPLTITKLSPIDRAISTAGGVAWSSMDRHCMLSAHPGVFVAGEMLDWDAPTGGYLLQATFATAQRAADGLLMWLERPQERQTGDTAF